MFSRSIVFAGLLTGASLLSAAPTCIPTGFFRDGINMTAAVMNPAGTVSGDIDATGCNIGVYYDHGSGSIKNATIHGANYFGVVANADIASVSLDVTNSSVHDIGEVPFNGTQHGVGIYFRALGAGQATGKITGNTVTRYQKGGIVVNGNSSVNISDNIVTGLGRVDFIAMNGIQVGFGATGQVMRNTVSGNAYTGANNAVSCGILVFGGDPDPYAIGLQIQGNTVVNNDIGIYVSNIDGLGNPPSTATNNKIVNNTITNDGLTNISGNFTGGYQAGVLDNGNNDKIINNTISGAGYATTNTPAIFATPIDVSFTNRPKVHANK